MKRSLKNYFSFLRQAFKNWWSKDPFRESAIIAYYAIFSMPGLLVLVITVAGYFFSRDVISSRILGQIQQTLGVDAASLLKEIIEAKANVKGSMWAVIIGVATILFGSTAVFAQFQKTLNIIWEVKAEPNKSGILKLIKVRLFSFGMILSIAFILLVWFFISSALAAFSDWLRANFPDYLIILFYALNFVFALAIFTVLFAMMFKIFPDVEIDWKDVWLGAIVTALLFIIGETALTFYFGKANPGKGYGPAGSIILILLWASYSSMIVFYGAEFTKVFAHDRHKYIPPKAVAKTNAGRES